MGCRARRAGRHHRARRLDRCRSFGCAWHAGGAHAPDRIIAAAALARRYPNARVVFSGGSANLISNDAREADFAGAIFESLGIDKIAADHGTAIRATPRRTPNSPRSWSRRRTGRALAAGDVGLSHAAIGRHVPQGADLPSSPIPWIGGSADATTDVVLTMSPSKGSARTDIAVREWIGPRGLPAHRQDRASCCRGRRRSRRSQAGSAGLQSRQGATFNAPSRE